MQKELKSFILVLVISAISTCAWSAIPRYSTNPQDFVSTNYQHFWVNGQPFRFTGFNIRGMVHYGYDDILPASRTSDRQSNLNYMQTVGAKVARVFLPSKFVSIQEVGDRLDETLQIASQYNVRIIVAFTDEYHTGFCPQGDHVYYTYMGCLGTSFFTSGYNNNYIPLVNHIVNRFKNDPVVFCWQVGNELKTPWNPTEIMPFCRNVAAHIRSMDSRHLVSYGTASYEFSKLDWDQAEQLYQDFDFLTIHPYNGREFVNDAVLADYLGKPLVIQEAGFDSSYSNRPAATDADIAKWVERGARGYMNWGLMATGSINIGDGDMTFGIDQVYHASDWNGYKSVYQKWSQTLSTTVIPPPPIPDGVTASDGTWADRVSIAWNPTLPVNECAVFRSDTLNGVKTQVSEWQTSVEYFDTSVQRGKTYYYFVKARNPGGESSFSSAQTGYANAAPELTISQAKELDDGSVVYIIRGVITAAYAYHFYMQQSMGSAVRVDWLPLISEGGTVDVLGTLKTSASGERIIEAMSVVLVTQ